MTHFNVGDIVWLKKSIVSPYRITTTGVKCIVKEKVEEDSGYFSVEPIGGPMHSAGNRGFAVRESYFELVDNGIDWV